MESFYPQAHVSLAEYGSLKYLHGVFSLPFPFVPCLVAFPLSRRARFFLSPGRQLLVYQLLYSSQSCIFVYFYGAWGCLWGGGGVYYAGGAFILVADWVFFLCFIGLVGFLYMVSHLL